LVGVWTAARLKRPTSMIALNLALIVAGGWLVLTRLTVTTVRA
jgi:hypothetical protein